MGGGERYVQVYKLKRLWLNFRSLNLIVTIMVYLYQTGYKMRDVIATIF